MFLWSSDDDAEDDGRRNSWIARPSVCRPAAVEISATTPVTSQPLAFQSSRQARNSGAFRAHVNIRQPKD